MVAAPDVTSILPTAHQPSTGIAAALVNVGQGLMLGRNGDGGSANTALTASSGIPDLTGMDVQAQLDLLMTRLEVENRIRDGAENLLQVFETSSPEGKDALRQQVEEELETAKTKIANINRKLDELRDTLPGTSRPKKVSNLSGPSFSRRTPFGPLHARSRDDNVDRDDIKTALANANTLIRTLASYPAPAAVSSNQTAPGSDPTNLDESRITTMNSLVTTLQRNVRVRYELDFREVVKAATPCLSDHSSKEARASAYRLVRHVIVDAESARWLWEVGIDWFIVRSLARDSKHGIEKEQVLKLIRWIVECGSSSSPSTSAFSPFSLRAGAGRLGPPGGAMGLDLDGYEDLNQERDEGEESGLALSEPVMRALIAVAEHPEDPLRLACLLTLAEIVLLDIDILTRTGGLRVLLQSLIEGPEELAPTLMTVFLHIIDSPRGRSHFTVGVDLEIALSGFTDAYGRGNSAANIAQMRASSRVICVMLRTWSGLLYLCIDNKKSLSSLIDVLRIPSLDTREVILDTFFELLNIKTPDWYQTFLDGRRLTMYRHAPNQGAHAHRDNRDPSNGSGECKINITDQFMAILLLVLVEAGLLEALVGILEEPECSTNFSKKTTLLLSEILHISTRILPLPVAARMQSLPRLFTLAAEHGPSFGRQLASDAFSSIDSFNRNRPRLDVSLDAANKRKRANSIEDARRTQRPDPKVQMANHVDDKAFQQLLVDSQVPVTRDHTKWNFEILNELLEGPFLNPKRLEEAFKISKFGRRLMTFFHPKEKKGFASVKKTKPNARYVRLGCAILTTMIKSTEGIRYLSIEDPLLSQLAECFHEIDPFMASSTPVDPIFSKQHVEDTLTYGYFEMLGTLSRYPEGIELMERHHLFTAFYHISGLQSRDDLIKGIVENIDYTIDGHPRIVLSKALTSSYKHIRIYATKHLGSLILSSASDPKTQANEWTLRLLITQLYDPDIEVADLAVRFLEDVCESKEMVEMVVKMQPTLDHLGELGSGLLLKFMSTTIGFRYLYHAEYIDREMDAWFHERNYHYAVQVEVYLSKMFSPMRSSQPQDMIGFDGLVPPHFYGEMAKTSLGCQVLAEKGHFDDFSDFVQLHGLEDEDFEIISKLKSVLWAVGNIGASPGGLLFLEEANIIPYIVKIAEESLILSVRGTCFYVLGLISSTRQGAELLTEYGWDATLTPLQVATGVCVPANVSKFVSIPSWSPPPSLISPPKPEGVVGRLKSQAEQDVLAAISNLSNTVIANEAARTLAKLKGRRPKLFSSLGLYCRVLRVMSTQRYRLPVRRYIMELFDVRLDGNVVQTIANTAYHSSVSQEREEGGMNEGEMGGDDETFNVGKRATMMIGKGLGELDMDSYDERMDGDDEGGKSVKVVVARERYTGFDAPDSAGGGGGSE